jgi:hypothetical protein
MQNLVEKYTPEAPEANDEGVVAIEYVLVAAASSPCSPASICGAIWPPSSTASSAKADKQGGPGSGPPCFA